MDIPQAKQFGDMLKKFRLRAGFKNQERLGHALGLKGRGDISAWEGGSLPRDRSVVLKLADRLNLSKSETDELLLAAHFQQEYYTQGAPSSTTDRGGHLYVAHIFIDENDEIPAIDITLHNKGSQTVLPTQVEVDVLDVGEFRFCDNEGDEDEDEDDLTRSFLLVSRNYDVKLSPALKGKSTSVKIAHLLRADEADRFQLKMNQDQAGWSLAYVWYYLRLTLLYDKPVRRLNVEPILLSLPPVVADDIQDVWLPFHTTCGEQNRATLQRMSKLEANRSASIETAIQQVMGDEEQNVE